MKDDLASKEILVQKLQALLNMTVANGCTESEALVAAGKAAELLQRCGLSMQELKAGAPDQLCHQNSLSCGLPRYTHEVRFLAPIIAEFTKTKTWISHTNTEVQVTFFGLKADVQIASYLFDVFRTAMETEWAVYWGYWGAEPNVNRRTTRRSFMFGIIKRLQARIGELIEKTKSAPVLSESREIVVLRAEIVEKAFRDLDIRLKKSRRKISNNLNANAFAAGQVAGDNVSISSGALDNHR
jgi:hypothetical protein